MHFSYYVIPVLVTGISTSTLPRSIPVTSTGMTRGGIDTAAPSKADHGRGERLA